MKEFQNKLIVHGLMKTMTSILSLKEELSKEENQMYILNIGISLEDL